MAKIAAAMCVMGDPVYFKFASYSIPSFLRNNTQTDLYVITDTPEKVEKYQPLSERLAIKDMREYLNENEEMIKEFEGKCRSREALKSRNERYGYEFRDIFPVIMPLMVEDVLKGKDYSHVLKIDSEGYFAGGDMMALVRDDVERASTADFFLVERKHPLMEHYGGGMPGSGFTLWRIKGRFIAEYIRSFTGGQQLTILNMRSSPRVNVKILTRPGYHLVRPFAKAEATGKVFTKEMAEAFLPAYIHLFGKNALRHYKTLEEWFGEESK